jgi:peptidoglycan/xylan/chitin deacetylase (PgdA/CDA1 family)
MVLRNMSDSPAPSWGPLTRTAREITGMFRGNRACLLTFHRAAPAAVWNRLPNRNFYLELEYLERLLSHLAKRGWEVVTIEDALRRLAGNETGKKFVNFSIDDCYRDTFELVVPLFRKFNAPVTLFLTTGIPDGHLPMWGAGLEEILLRSERIVSDGRRQDVHTLELKRAAFNSLEHAWDGAQAPERYAIFCKENGFDAQEIHQRHAISWEMLDKLKCEPLVEIGAHTVSHARVSALPEAEALAEMAGSRRRIAERLGVDARHFAFPYGRAGDAGPRDFELARAAGFSSAATTRKGLFRGGDRFCLPRNTLNGAAKSLAMADAHLTGISGLAAKMLGRV